MKTLTLTVVLVLALCAIATADDANAYTWDQVDAQVMFEVHHCQKYALPEGGVDLLACYLDPTTVDGYVDPNWMPWPNNHSPWSDNQPPRTEPTPESSALALLLAGSLGLLFLKKP